VRRRYGTLRSIFAAAAVEAELLVRSPCQVKLDDARNEPGQLPTPHEIERLIRVIALAYVAMVVVTVATARSGARLPGSGSVTSTCCGRR
jgi:hypothetical protein